MESEEKKPKIDIEIDLDSSPSSDEILDDLADARESVSISREQANEAQAQLVESGALDRNMADLSASRDDRLVALLCYIIPFLMSLLVLMSESGQRRAFQRYHAIQGLGLAVGLAVLATGMGIFMSVIWIIPIIGWLIWAVLACLSPIGAAMMVLAHAYYGYQGYKGRRFTIPLVTAFLRDQGWL